jgi:tetratricopeptide (TPR) repeat protein
MCCNMGHLLTVSKEPATALPWFDRAEKILQGVLSEVPKDETVLLFLRNTYAQRARALDQLERHDEAVPNWNRAAELDTGSQRAAFQVSEAGSLSRAGRQSDAAQLMESVIHGDPTLGSPSTLYEAARVFAVCSREDSRSDADETKQTGALDQTKSSDQQPSPEASQREKWAARSVEQLKRAQESGFFKQTENINRLETESDFSTIRSRTDFEAFSKALRGDAKAVGQADAT